MSFLTAATPRGRKARQTAIRRTLSDLDLSRAVSNILHAYDIASADQRDAGRRWYREAHEYAGADDLGCGVLAALSPGTSWERNLYLADVLHDTGDTPHAYGDAIRKAQAIRDGADPLDTLGGRKVRSFYHNIRHPNRTGHVTIDRHAASLALLGMSAERRARTATLSDSDLKILSRPGAYVMLAACYRTAARKRNVSPHAMQAVTWLVWREANAYRTQKDDF